MQDISGFGLQVNLRASVTFPQGINITQFADDADPFDLPEITLAESAMGMNGDLIGWSRANPIAMTLSVVPNGDDDMNLAVLAEANRAARGKNPARDVITITAIYPDGRTLTLSQGMILTAMPGKSVASAGRMKSQTYGFTFENKTETR